MESTLIVSSVKSPKKFRCPYFREEGGGQAGCQNVFIFYVLMPNKSNVFKYSLYFFEGFSNID